MTTKRYTVTVTTGDVQYADTRANVYITLHGTLTSCPETHLEGEFGIGTTRVFSIDSPDLGNLERVDIRHDDTGYAPDWFLDKVIIKEEETGAEWVFACDGWLKSPTLSRTLLGEILTLRRVWAWGYNEWAQLGSGSTTPAYRPTPGQVLCLTGVKAIAAGGWFSLALREDGIWAWGANDWGQLGTGSTTPDRRPMPGQVPCLCLTGVKAIAAGYWFNLALRNDGTVLAWGANDRGQLGTGSTTPVLCTAPGQVPGLTEVKAIAAVGRWSNLALREDGVWAWGGNEWGQLGTGSITPDYRPTPGQVLGLPKKVKAIAAGGWSSLALLEDDTVWAWGANNRGQLGTGNITPDRRPTPVQVQGLPKKVKAIAGGGQFSLALLEDDTVWAWGANEWGQLGTGSTTPAYRPTPGQVLGLPKKVKAIAAGGQDGSQFSLALLEDGTVWAWGANELGQLGTGSTTPDRRPTPGQVPGLTGVKTIAAGGWFSLAAG